MIFPDTGSWWAGNIWGWGVCNVGCIFSSELCNDLTENASCFESHCWVSIAWICLKIGYFGVLSNALLCRFQLIDDMPWMLRLSCQSAANQVYLPLSTFDRGFLPMEVFLLKFSEPYCKADGC